MSSPLLTDSTPKVWLPTGTNVGAEAQTSTLKRAANKQPDRAMLDPRRRGKRRQRIAAQIEDRARVLDADRVMREHVQGCAPTDTRSTLMVMAGEPAARRQVVTQFGDRTPMRGRLGERKPIGSKTKLV